MSHKTSHKASHTIMRSGRYHFKMRVPGSVRMIQFSLKTTDRDEARALAAQYAMNIRRQAKSLIKIRDVTIDHGCAEAERKTLKDLREMMPELFDGPSGPTGPNDPPGTPGQVITETFEKYLTEKTEKGSLKDSGKIRALSCLSLYREYINCENTDEIDEEKHAGFTHFVCKLPSNREKRVEYKEYSATELSRMKIPDEHKMKANTICNIVATVNGWIRWLKRKKIADLQLLDSVSKKRKETDREVKRAFSQDDFKKINEITKSISNAHIRLICELSLCTGARAGEIAQLEASDITEDEIPSISINEKKVSTESFSKTLKTAKSRRTIPIPTHLRERVLKLARARKAQGGGRIFNLIKIPASGMLSVPISKAFNARVKSAGFSKEYSLHSLRHTFISEAHRTSAKTETIKKITGHEQQSVHETAYLHHALEEMLEIVDEVSQRVKNAIE